MFTECIRVSIFWNLKRCFNSLRLNLCRKAVKRSTLLTTHQIRKTLGVWRYVRMRSLIHFGRQHKLDATWPVPVEWKAQKEYPPGFHSQAFVRANILQHMQKGPSSRNVHHSNAYNSKGLPTNGEWWCMHISKMECHKVLKYEKSICTCKSHTT